MTTIPETIRGYRDGYRTIVTAMHDSAKEQSEYGARASLDCHAHTVGILGSNRTRYLLLKRDDPVASRKLRDSIRGELPVTPPLPRYRTNAERNAITDAARNLSKYAGRTPDYLSGYIEGLDDAIGSVENRLEQLCDPLARKGVKAFIQTIHEQLAVLMAGKTTLRVRWPQPVIQKPRKTSKT